LTERLYADTEGDGLLNETTKLHCLSIVNLDTDEVDGYADQPGYTPIKVGLKRLEEAKLVVGHNWLKHDHPVIKKIYPKYAPKGMIRDTLVLSKLFWNQIKEQDFKRKGFPPALLMRPHSLAAWGWRLGNRKADYDGGWETFSPEMYDYCLQDSRVGAQLYRRCEKEAEAWGVPLEEAHPEPKVSCVELEHRIAAICGLIEQHGFAVDEDKLVALSAKLAARRAALEAELQVAFPPKTVSEEFTPKVNNKTRGYVKGVPFTKTRVVPFNPGSRHHIGERLIQLGWEPSDFNKDGTPSVDDDTLSSLPWPQAKVLGEFLMVQKRLGQVANGPQAWLRKLKNGRIHGRIDSGGTHTGRAAHSDPNMGQVPACGVPFGADCRGSFRADRGHVLVGTDMEALELRDLAAYMARYDGGAYIKTVLEGDKALGTDMHSINARLIGCSRDTAKVFFYAMIYGAGDMKLGETLGLMGRKAMAAGKLARARLLRGVPALGKLVESIQKTINKRGYLIGLDGRHLKARSVNAALNTLLQSAGAVQSKRWIVILFDMLTEMGLEWGSDWAIVAWVHDETQKTTKPEFAELVGQKAVECIEEAGEFYNFRCPLTGQAKTGDTWAATH
jgi:DNA polymerase I